MQLIQNVGQNVVENVGQEIIQDIEIRALSQPDSRTNSVCFPLQIYREDMTQIGHTSHGIRGKSLS
jgi:hypothetical protein